MVVWRGNSACLGGYSGASAVPKMHTGWAQAHRHLPTEILYVASSSGSVATVLQKLCNVSFQITMILTEYFWEKGVCIRWADWPASNPRPPPSLKYCLTQFFSQEKEGCFIQFMIGFFSNTLSSAQEQTRKDQPYQSSTHQPVFLSLIAFHFPLLAQVYDPTHSSTLPPLLGVF